MPILPSRSVTKDGSNLGKWVSLEYTGLTDHTDTLCMKS
jgi:hypothetical protein